MSNNKNKIHNQNKNQINVHSLSYYSSKSKSLQTTGKKISPVALRQAPLAPVSGNIMPSVSGFRKHTTLKAFLPRKRENFVPWRKIYKKYVLPAESIADFQRYLLTRFNPSCYKKPSAKWLRKNKYVGKINNWRKKQWLIDQQLIRKLYRYPYLCYHILNATRGNFWMRYNLHYFLWQSRHFLKFLTLHPDLFHRTLQSLHTLSLLPKAPTTSPSRACLGETSTTLMVPAVKNRYLDDQHKLELFLTQFWIHFFDYFQLYRKTRWKWKGIRIRLSGRLGFRKMGRARRQLTYWGETRMSGAIFPLQYSYSQIRTRYGVVGMRIAIH